MSKRKIKRPTPEEDAKINAQIADDPDDFEADAEFFARAKPADPSMQQLTRKYRGKQKAPTKIATSLRLSKDVLEAFKDNTDKHGPAMDEALRAFAVRKGWITDASAKPAKRAGRKKSA